MTNQEASPEMLVEGAGNTPPMSLKCYTFCFEICMSTFLNKLGTTLSMIKFEHTLFALPFAFLGAILAANGLPTWWQLLWITVAMVGARSAAMTFNRIADREIDARNPRTANRELP